MSKEIILRNGTFSIETLSEMIHSSYNTIKDKPSLITRKLSCHCDVIKEGRGDKAMYTLSNVPKGSIPKNEFGKTKKEIETPRKERSDKGKTREGYNSIKENFKPLIYSLVASSPDLSYTGSFNNWMEHSQLTTRAWGLMNRKYNNGDIDDIQINEFFRVEGRSLNATFNSALDSMEKEGAIKKETVRIAVISGKDLIEEFGKNEWFSKLNKYVVLESDDPRLEEIELIESKLCEKFNISKISDLAYGNKELNIKMDLPKLKEFKNKFNAIISERYGYIMCFRATKVSITNPDTIEYFKDKYGINEDMQGFVNACKDKIYDSRLKRAEIRYTKKINDKKRLINEQRDKEREEITWGDEEFVELLRELDLSSIPSLKYYIDKWINCYKIYIHEK